MFSRKFAFRFLLLCLIGFAINPVVTAQSAQDIQNLQNVDVDELTDAQVQKFIDQMEASGYSQQQLEMMARARGMSSTQITKLRQRIEEVRSKGTKGAGAGGADRTRQLPDIDYNRQSNAENRSAGFDPFSTIFPEDTLAEEDELKIFGLSFFENKNLTFEPSVNIATPKGYQVGPGDQIIIDVWGASEQTYQLDVSPEGNIVIPSLGPVYLNGLSMEQAEARIKSRLKNIYSTLGQNTHAQVSLGQIRTISVNVVGEVKKPGTYQLSSFATAFNALYRAGGPGESGSLREIQVFRGGKKETTMDAYNFLVYGEGQNIILQDQDVILVKPFINRIAVDGEVKRPAYYEAKEGESLAKVLKFAGGFTGAAYTKSISLRRNLANRKTVQTVSREQYDDFAVQGGDYIEVGKIANQFENRVRIEGAVNHPGEFELKEEMKLSDALQLADGFREDAFMQRGVILRQNPDMTLSSMAFSPARLMNGEFDMELRSEDLIKIQSIFDLREVFNVSIQGEVQVPGPYPYAENMTVEDLIYLANGFKESAAKSFVEVARRLTDQTGDEAAASKIFNFPINSKLQISDEASNFTLKPFDLVVIRRSPFYEKQIIMDVEGEVQFPGKYVLERKDERISSILERTGGLTQYAYAEGATLIRRTEYYNLEIEAETEGEVLYDKEGKKVKVDRKRNKEEDDTGEDTNTATRLRREELQQLFKRDTTLLQSGAGVFKQQESIGIQLDEIIKNPGGKHDLILREGDVLSIPRELQTVRVRGEVLYPSTIRYDGSSSFRDFISQSGGFTEDAKKNKAYILYANGSAQRTKAFLWFRDFPKVEPGAEIIIPNKNRREPLSPQAWISMTSGIATMSLVILRIMDRL